MLFEMYYMVFIRRFKFVFFGIVLYKYPSLLFPTDFLLEFCQDCMIASQETKFHLVLSHDVIDNKTCLKDWLYFFKNVLLLCNVSLVYSCLSTVSLVITVYQNCLLLLPNLFLFSQRNKLYYALISNLYALGNTRKILFLNRIQHEFFLYSV